jgi:hypothetical protein
VLDGPREQFAVERVAAGGERARVYVNLSREPSTAELEPGGWRDFAGRSACARVELAPWSSMWLRDD